MFSTFCCCLGSVQLFLSFHLLLKVKLFDICEYYIVEAILIFSCRCREEDKDAYLYYILAVHGHGQTIVFCTSISALRHISSILLILGVNVYTLHGDMQQRARLKVCTTLYVSIYYHVCCTENVYMASFSCYFLSPFGF